MNLDQPKTCERCDVTWNDCLEDHTCRTTYEGIRDLQVRFGWSDESLLTLICEFLDRRAATPNHGADLLRDLIVMGEEEANRT